MKNNEPMDLIDLSMLQFRLLLSPHQDVVYNVPGLGHMHWTGTTWEQLWRGPNDQIWDNSKNKVEQEVTFSYNGSAFPSENNFTVKATPLEGDITWSNPVKDAGDFWFNQTDLDEMKKHVINPNKVDNKCKSWDTFGKHTFYKPGIDFKDFLDKAGKELQKNPKDLVEDKLFTELAESLRRNVRKEFVDNFEEYVKDLYHDWKEEILKHDAFLVRNDRLITVDIVDPDDNDHVILLFYRGKKRIASFVESLSWFPGNESKAEEFEVWQKQAFMQDPHAKYIRLQSMIDWYFDSSQLNMYYNH